MVRNVDKNISAFITTMITMEICVRYGNRKTIRGIGVSMDLFSRLTTK